MDFGQFTKPNPLSIALQSAIMPGDQPPGVPTMPAPTPHKMDRGQMIAGILADALAGAMGRPGQFAQTLQRQQEQENEMANWGLQRRGRLEDYEAQKQIDQRYPSDRAPYRFEDNGGNVWELGPDGKPRKVFADPIPKYVPDGVGGMMQIPGTGASPAPAPTAAPPGITFTPIPGGGPTRPASGGFR